MNHGQVGLELLVCEVVGKALHRVAVVEDGLLEALGLARAGAGRDQGRAVLGPPKTLESAFLRAEIQFFVLTLP